MQLSYRILKPSDIPRTLWNATSKVLSISPALTGIYVEMLKHYGLMELAGARDSTDPPVGGINKEQTDRHFAQAFDGSVVRVQLAVLDPMDDTAPSSNVLLSYLLGNVTSLVDVPCGAGAATLALLSTIAELRAREVLPRLPLDVILVGGEVSEYARAYAIDALGRLGPTLESQGIVVRSEFFHWDATDPLSNTELIKRITTKSECATQRLLVVANFNGFLERAGKRAQASPQLEELFRYVSGDNSAAIWIEPDMNRVNAEGGLFPWLRQRISTACKRFAAFIGGRSEGHAGHVSRARFVVPHQPENTARVGLAVELIRLEKADK